MPAWRKATWALVIWGVLMIPWILTATTWPGDFDCSSETGAAKAVCEAGAAVGESLGITLTATIIGLIGFAILGLIWVASRPPHEESYR